MNAHQMHIHIGNISTSSEKHTDRVSFDQHSCLVCITFLCGLYHLGRLSLSQSLLIGKILWSVIQTAALRMTTTRRSSLTLNETMNIQKNEQLVLLETLQQSIAQGLGEKAAQAALKLANHKVLCDINAINLKIRFEDVRVNDECLMIPVNSLTTIEQLQKQIYQKYKVPIYNQRFTFVKTDERDSAAGDVRSPDEQTEEKNGTNFETYLELLNYENTELVTNLDEFECSICLTIYYAGDGVILKACLHTFCRNCLREFINQSSDAEIKCPYLDSDYTCGALVQEREIKALLSSEEYEKHLSRSINEAESKMQNTFHCRTANCIGWCIFEDNVNYFPCPVCLEVNCLTCQVIHTGLNCRQYQDELRLKAANDKTANETKLKLEAMLKSGEAMKCPTCSIVIMKKEGCDAITCSMCKTEICWVTKGPRWGPNGKGDTSGGCRCNVNGVRCHPQCANCH